jgi:ABC transporter
MTSPPTCASSSPPRSPRPDSMDDTNTSGTATTVAGPAVEIHDLVVERGGHRALDHPSFTVAPGVVTGLLGPSGSGKTTLMRAIVGTQRVRRGRVTVLGLPSGARSGPALRARHRLRTDLDRHRRARGLSAGVIQRPLRPERSPATDPVAVPYLACGLSSDLMTWSCLCERIISCRFGTGSVS